MHKSDTDQYTITEENAYCPDHINRKKEKGSLDDFIKNIEK